MLQGAVDSDPGKDHRVPMVVIDGREISWDELMVAIFEGWQFKLRFRDRREEVRSGSSREAAGCGRRWGESTP